MPDARQNMLIHIAESRKMREDEGTILSMRTTEVGLCDADEVGSFYWRGVIDDPTRPMTDVPKASGTGTLALAMI